MKTQAEIDVIIKAVYEQFAYVMFLVEDLKSCIGNLEIFCEEVRDEENKDTKEPKNPIDRQR